MKEEREKNMSEKIVVCLEKGGARDMAEAFSRRTNTPISEKPGEHLTVLFNSKGVSLTGYGLTYQGDFENMLHRVTNGRLQHEMLVRASKSEKPGRKAIDATAGMGEDGFLLAAQGYEVTLYEQNPVIAVLLKDALRRAKKHPVLKEIAARMPSQPGPGIINIVIDHENFAFILIYHPGRSSHMCHRVFSGKSIGIISDPVQNKLLIRLFLFIEGGIMLNLVK